MSIDPRDLFVRLNPLGLDERDLEKDSTGFTDNRTHGDYLVFLAGYKAGTVDGEERECQRHRPINAEGYKPEISTLLPGIPCAGAAGVHNLNQAEGCKPDLSIRPSTPEAEQRLREALQCMGAANVKYIQYHLDFLAEREEKDQLLEEALDAAASVGMHDLVARINNALATDTSEMIPSPALVDVLAERRRQIDLEGYTTERDDQYVNGELSEAAAAYAFWSFTSRLLPPNRKLEPPASWPWDREHWKPTTQRHMLIKAGALILAELERLDRQQAREVAHG